MKTLKYLFSIIALSLALFSCNNTSQPKGTIQAEQSKPIHTIRTGNYVSNDYAKRTEGYDWVAVKVEQLSAKQIEVKVRSRVDIKKPTCTFDTKARMLNDSTYQAKAKGKIVLFTFQNDAIKISTKKEEDNAILNFYCSGGGSLAGAYSKIEEELDANADPSIYNNVLVLQGIGFNISSIASKEGKTLIVAPFGLSIDNTPFEKTFQGKITGSEIEDLNSDGFPEVLIYTQTQENNAGYVEAFSVNNGKSMSMAYFRPTTEDSRISTGYNGYDEFSLVENMLGQRFPIYENGKPTGKTRQVMYSLKDGEAMRFFELQNVSEY